MCASLRRLLTITAIFLLSVATVDAGDNEGKKPPLRGPIFDITHFDEEVRSTQVNVRLLPKPRVARNRSL
jgi:hypothetical protein